MHDRFKAFLDGGQGQHDLGGGVGGRRGDASGEEARRGGGEDRGDEYRRGERGAGPSPGRGRGPGAVDGRDGGGGGDGRRGHACHERGGHERGPPAGARPAGGPTEARRRLGPLDPPLKQVHRIKIVGKW